MSSVGESRGSEQYHLHQSLESFIDYSNYTDIVGYVLSLTITMKVNQRRRILNFRAPLASHSMMVMVIRSRGIDG